jgi:UDP-N-acetylglucosamine:LPS N-acetylglucosamine transferase
MKVALVCSSGGHLAQLYRLEPWWREHDRFWVTFDTDDATSLLRDERTVWAHHPTTRNLPNALRNLRLAWGVLRRERPDVVISDGAGVAVPFFVLARLLGIRTVYIEVVDRIETPTLTGRLVYPFADRLCAQWPEQIELYPRAVDIGALL